MSRTITEVPNRVGNDAFPNRKGRPTGSRDTGSSGALIGSQIATDASPCVSYQCTTDLSITSISSNVMDLLGIAPEGVLNSRNFWEERISCDDRKRLIAHLDRLDFMQIGSTIHRITDDRGLPVWVTHSFRKLKMAGGEIIVGSLIPLANELCANRFDGSTISQFVHQIGNHFQVSNLIIGSLKRLAINTEELDSLQQTMDRAVEFTRAFSRYVQAPSNLGAVDLFELIDGVVSWATPLCREMNLTLESEIEEDLAGRLLLGDEYLLELALKCVLQNAIDANGDNIVLAAQRVCSDSRRPEIARILITDNGAGMDADMATKAAEPFVTSKRDADGLGLSTAARLIEIHGGAVNVSSTLKQGTQVEILLPFAEEPIVPE